MAGGDEIVGLSHLRFAAGVCVLAAGLLMGGAGGAVAVADPDSSGSAAHGDDGTNASGQQLHRREASPKKEPGGTATTARTRKTERLAPARGNRRQHIGNRRQHIGNRRAAHRGTGASTSRNRRSTSGTGASTSRDRRQHIGNRRQHIVAGNRRRSTSGTGASTSGNRRQHIGNRRQHMREPAPAHRDRGHHMRAPRPPHREPAPAPWDGAGTPGRRHHIGGAGHHSGTGY